MSALPDRRPDPAHWHEATMGPRIPALDGLRGLAILPVLFLHLAPTSHGFPPPTVAVDRAFIALTRTGWIGVDLFFVLSGFLITGILYDTKGSRHYFRQFYARRVLRIFPLYYGTLALFLVVLPALRPEHWILRDLRADAPWYWTYLYNVKVASTGFLPSSALGHFWSLAVEEQFYLVWPLLVLWLNRRQLLWACGAAFLTALACRATLSATHYVVLTDVWTPARMDALATGAFVAVLARTPGAWEHVRRWAVPVGLAAGLPIAAWLAGDAFFGLGDTTLLTGGHTLLALAFGALLVVALTSSPGGAVGRAMASPSLRFLGRYSYALYVFHHVLFYNGLPLGRLGAKLAGVPTVLGSSAPAYALWLGLSGTATVAVAYASWHLWEKQFLKLKRFFPYESGTRPPSSQPAAVPVAADSAVAGRFMPS